jgi:hypothetical protein
VAEDEAGCEANKNQIIFIIKLLRVVENDSNDSLQLKLHYFPPNYGGYDLHSSTIVG